MAFHQNLSVSLLFKSNFINMKIYFRKTFKYNPCHSGLSKYESYEAVTRQQYSPGITNFDSGERFDLRTFCSSLTRGQQTAERISTVQIVKLDQLREIEFSLHNLVSKEEFESNGSSLVRERFIKSFVDDTLLEKRAEKAVIRKPFLKATF